MLQKMDYDGLSAELAFGVIILDAIFIEVWQIGADERQVVFMKSPDVVTNKALACAGRDQYQFVFGMKMPRGGIVAIVEKLHDKGFLRFYRQSFEYGLHDGILLSRN